MNTRPSSEKLDRLNQEFSELNQRYQAGFGQEGDRLKLELMEEEIMEEKGRLARLRIAESIRRDQQNSENVCGCPLNPFFHMRLISAGYGNTLFRFA